MKIFHNYITEKYHLIQNRGMWYLIAIENDEILVLAEFDVDEYISEKEIADASVKGTQAYWQHRKDSAVLRLRDELMPFPANYYKHFGHLLNKLEMINLNQLALFIYDKIVAKMKA